MRPSEMENPGAGGLMTSLHPLHLADLRESGLTDKTIKAAGVYTVPPDEVGKRLGGLANGVVSALAFPYLGCDGYERYKVWREETADPKAPKYLQKTGTPNRLYLPSTVDLKDDSDLLLVEGEKKSLALWQSGFEVVGLGGIWNWCERSQGYKRPKLTRPIADLDRVNWRRTVTIIFDSDGHDNRNVLLAALRLGRELSHRGAAVSILFLPADKNGGKVGADDFLVEHGSDHLAALLKTAWLFDPNLDDREAEIAWMTRDLTPESPPTDKLKALAALVPTLARMRELDRVAVQEKLRERLALPAKFISALNKDIQKTVKANGTKAKTENGQQEVYTALFDSLIDLVEHEGSPAFLVKQDGILGITAQVELEGVTHLPPPKEQIPWLLARGEEVIKAYKRAESPGALYDDLLDYFRGVSELPGETYYDLNAAWTFHTYLMEFHQYSPMLCNYAVPERGKSRTGKGMIYVAYRGIHVESLRDAYIVRIAHSYMATIFFDCMNLWKKAEKAGSEDILLLRFERGAKVPRVLYPERGAHRDTVYFSVYGATIIATNISVHNILDTRAVQINMPQSRKRFENDVTPEFALPLKERLTAFRARFLGKSLPEIAKPARGRLGDILKPLLQIIKLVKPEREQIFLSLVKELEKDRMLDKADSLEAQILVTLKNLKDEVFRGILPVKTITDTFNEGRPEHSHFTYHRIGHKLRSLGFQKAKTVDGASAIIWDEQKIECNFSAYGLGKTSEIPETSEMPDEKPDVSDQSDVSDVFSPVREGKNHHQLFSCSRLATWPTLFLWNRERQRQAAQAGKGPDADLWAGKEVKL